MIIQERSQFVQMLRPVQAGREINEVFACESNEFPLHSPREEECTLEVNQIYFHALNSINVPPTNTNDPAVDGMVLNGCVVVGFIPLEV